MKIKIVDDCPVWVVLDNKAKIAYVYTRKLDAVYKHVEYKARRISARKFHADYREFNTKAKLTTLPRDYRVVE